MFMFMAQCIIGRRYICACFGEIFPLCHQKCKVYIISDGACVCDQWMYSKIKGMWLAVKGGWKTVVGVGFASRGFFLALMVLAFYVRKRI